MSAAVLARLEQGDPVRASILRAVLDLTIQHACPPTYRDVMAAVGITSTGHFVHHQRFLEQEGYLAAKQPKRSCRLRVTPAGEWWLAQREAHRTLVAERFA